MGALLLSAPALAQGGIERPSGGAQAIQPLPDFATPRPEEAPPPPPPPAPPPETGMLRLEHVLVTASAPARPAALPRWRPAADPASGLTLHHAPGQPLDAQWVSDQFTSNGLLDREVGFDRVWALIQLINLAYVQNGYINSGLLIDQTGAVQDGALRLTLVMGRLAPGTHVQVRFAGPHRGLTERYVIARMPSARDVPLSIRAIERDFRLLADDPAIRTTQTDLRPGARPGEATLDVIVDPARRGDILLTYGNSRSPSVGGERIGIGGWLRHVLTGGDTLSLDYGRTEGLDDVSGAYSTPLFGPHTLLKLRGGYNSAAVSDPLLAILAIRSKEWVAEGGIEQTILRRPLLPGGAPAEDAALGFAVTHRRLDSSLLGLPFSFSPGAKDGRTEYTALRLTGQYVRRSSTTVLALSVTASFGLGGTQSALLGQEDAEDRFASLFVQANYARRIGRHRTELRLRLAGQAASDLLYAAERLGVGGMDTVRGYRENLLLADQALVGSVEVAQPIRLAPRTASDAFARAATVTLSVFADGALLRNISAVQPSARSIASVGAGLAWQPTDWLRATGSFAQALRDVVPPGQRDLQDRGFSFRLTVYPLGLLGL